MLELKTAFKLLIRGLLITAALIFVFLITLGFISLRNNSKPVLIKVAVSSTDQRLGDYISDMVSDIPGVTGTCELIMMDEAEALGKIKTGEISMAISIPDDFYERASAMEDVRLNIYTGEDLTVGEYKLLAMLKGISGLMEITDAQIMCMYETMAIHPMNVDKSGMEIGLFMKTLNDFGNRSDMFEISSVSAYGSYSVTQFYTASVLLGLTVLGGVMLFSMYSRESLQLERTLSRGKNSYIAISVSRICAMWISLGALSEVLVILLNLILTIKEITIGAEVLKPANIGIRLHLSVWIICLSISLWIHFTASLTGVGSAHFRVIYVTFILIMLISSGVIVPDVYLPAFLRKAAGYIPTGAMHRLLLSGLWDRNRIRGLYSINGLSVTLITCAFLLIVSVILYRRGLLKHD